MLSMGASQPWPKAMFALTGQYKMSAKPIIAYFEPLIKWLKKQNEGHNVTWSDKCPLGTFADPYYVDEPKTTAHPDSGKTTAHHSGVAAVISNLLAVLALSGAALLL